MVKEALSRPSETFTTSAPSTIPQSTSLQAIESLSLQGLTISPPQLALCPTTVVQRVHQIAQHLVRYLEMKEITESNLPEVDFRSDQYGVSTYDHITNTLTIFRSHESDGYALAELLSDWLHDQCLKLRTQESDPTTYQEEVPPLDENSPRVDTIALTLKLHQETSQDLQKVRDFCDTVCSSLLTQLSGDQGDGNPLDTALRRTTPLEAWQSWLEWNISLTKTFHEKFLGLQKLLSFEVEKHHPEVFGYALANSWLSKAARLRTDAANIFRLSIREIQSEYFYANTGPHTLPAARGPVTAPELS